MRAESCPVTNICASETIWHIDRRRLSQQTTKEIYMKNATALLILASALAMPVVYAADEDEHAGHHDATDNNQAGPTSKDDKAAGMKMKMHDQMKKMQEQMEKIHATSDPKARSKLMQDHMETMRETMKSMRGMGSDMMGKKKGEPMMEEGTNGADKGMDKDMNKDKGGMQMSMMMKKHYKMMEDRMDMMQKMMEQMMEHEAAEQEMEHGR